ncbi:MAG: hypothetical protein ABSD97_15330 [Acidimicrobiales bacterium]
MVTTKTQRTGSPTGKVQITEGSRAICTVTLCDRQAHRRRMTLSRTAGARMVA